ncbi:MAG: hypothetical protein JNL32_14330, partial [Candidatus Kapabacteria bacterium]|nr:hypothetical protein [Candidatus Kapabacteria bacterium]
MATPSPMRMIFLVALWELRQWLRNPAVLLITALSPVIILLFVSERFSRSERTADSTHSYFVGIVSDFD